MTGRFDPWIGRARVDRERVTPAMLARFLATIDASPQAGVPQGFHWCLAPPSVATALLDADGHPPRGDFLPPVALPRRMWAASRVEFLNPIAPDDALERRSTVAAVIAKRGATGDLVFVEIDHLTRTDGAIAVRERQTIVYRGAATAPTPLPPVITPDLSDWPWRRTVMPGVAMLFRYSAMTFNTHRIHYDLPYATDAEGYPALVVHGPLTATLLLDLCARQLGPDALARFDFRAASPAFVDQPLHLVGRPEAGAITLAALGGDGRTVMTASAIAR
ncbi:MaoC family dehydratase N-terminal domain-containing protein [uncultured Sphingomonas sp.]|uniref:FAS1-like dehydratase domain-containing protein n=1 Tax=uncultured Sphingomonas sp. TaxID=158754 RepID=UPI0035CB18BC